MSRTRRDILVLGRSPEEIRGLVQDWFSHNKFESVNQPTSIKGTWGSDFWTASKHFEVKFYPTEGGTIAVTEGWITPFCIGESDLSPDFIWGVIPKEEGWSAIQRLWDALEDFSKPSKYCTFCGRGLRSEVKFCPYCGKPQQAELKTAP